MEEIKRCTKCLLPSTLQDIKFDENGVCNHCLKYEEDFKDWDKIKNRKKNEFEVILTGAKKLKRAYDCLVPLSGGKDSTFVLYLCTKVYKMNTLAISLDNGFLSNPAKDNIRNALIRSNADHIYYTLNRENSNRLFKTFVERSGNFCTACMRGINYVTELALNNFNIPLIIVGSGRRVEYVSQIKEISGLHTPSYFANVLSGTGIEDKFKHFYSNKYKIEFQKILTGISDILKIPRITLMRFVPQHINLYDYIYKPYPEIVELIKEQMGWSDASKSIEHLDCELHNIPFYNHTLKIKNVSKGTFHRSGLIRQGLLSREKALEEEERDLTNNAPPKELMVFLKGNNISFDDYLSSVKKANNSKFEPKVQKLARTVYYKLRKL